MSDPEIIELIRQEKYSQVLDELYQNYPVFKNSFKKAGGNSSDATDIFQDALLILIQKISDADFKLNCHINTFLFGICRNLSHEYYRKKGKQSSMQIDIEEPFNESESIESFIEQENRYKALDRILLKIGKKCMEVLSLFYIQDLSMSEIAKRMGFKSEVSAKTQKYKCIEKARELTQIVLLELKSECT
jgi:RNA polymerase sigma factor (sigma-70 family)